MRKLLLLSPLVLALALGGCDDKTKPPAPAPAGGDVKTPATPAPSAPTPDDVPTDGGAEQAPSEPIPPAPGPAAQPATPPAPSPATFDHAPPGDIPAGQGHGYLDRTVWSPTLCWPLEDGAFANSQVYGHGGGGPAGTSQCDSVNYSLPWHDTFCEARSRDNPLCATGGTGHQGQDIRPATCKKNLHWAVAAEKGVITDIGSYTVTIVASAAPHRTYRYLHMQMAALAVKEGDTVNAAQKLGKVANDFGGTPTTIHLHFELRAGVAGVTTDGKAVVLHTFLPPYMSLAEAYQRKLNGGTCS